MAKLLDWLSNTLGSAVDAILPGDQSFLHQAPAPPPPVSTATRSTGANIGAGLGVGPSVPSVPYSAPMAAPNPTTPGFQLPSYKTSTPADLIDTINSMARVGPKYQAPIAKPDFAVGGSSEQSNGVQGTLQALGQIPFVGIPVQIGNQVVDMENRQFAGENVNPLTEATKTGVSLSPLGQAAQLFGGVANEATKALGINDGTTPAEANPLFGPTEAYSNQVQDQGLGRTALNTAFEVLGSAVPGAGPRPLREVGPTVGDAVAAARDVNTSLGQRGALGPKPVTIYHGTTPDSASAIEKSGFDLSKTADHSVWFTDNPKVGEVAASGKGGIVARQFDPSKLKWAGYAEDEKYTTDQLIKMGYDGLKLPGATGEPTFYRVFEPNKVLSKGSSLKSESGMANFNAPIGGKDPLMDSSKITPEAKASLARLDKEIAINEKLTSAKPVQPETKAAPTLRQQNPWPYDSLRGQVFDTLAATKGKASESDLLETARNYRSGQNGFMSDASLHRGINEAKMRYVVASEGKGGAAAPPEVPKGPSVPTPPEPARGGNLKPSQLIENTVKKSATTAPEVAKMDSVMYKELPNKESMNAALTKINADPEKALEEVMNPATHRDAITNAQGLILAERAQKKGNFQQAQDIFRAMQPGNTKAGQAIQVLSVWSKTSPEGVVKYAEKVVADANALFAQAKKSTRVTLTPEQAAGFRKQAEAIERMPDGRDKLVATQKMINAIHNIVPASLGTKLQHTLYYAQLLNPKTAIRNIGGNVGFAIGENFKDALGAPLDMAITAARRAAGDKTAHRSVYVPDIPGQLREFGRAAKETYGEAKQGINLSGYEGQLQVDAKPGAFNNPVGRFLDRAMKVELSVPDRAAFAARYWQSLKNSMRAEGVKEATPEMKAKAEYDGLYATFQDDSKAAQLFIALKGAFNKVGFKDGSFGLGSFVLNYPKTPGNLLARGIDYSPAGYVKTVLEASKPLFKNTPLGKAPVLNHLAGDFDQKAFVESFARATTGTVGLVGTGALLHNVGIITGDPDPSKNANASDVAQGLGKYRINASALKRYILSGFDPSAARIRPGDALVNYDWFQPFAISLSMGANMDENKGAKKGAVAKMIDQLGTTAGEVVSGAQTLVEQPIVTGVQKLFGGQSGSIPQGVTQLLEGVPASFIPTLLNQVGQLMDNTSRSTYDPNPVNATIRTAESKLPWAQRNLQPVVDVQGHDKERYQDGSNNLFNVFLNPAFITHFKSDKVLGEVQRLQDSTGSSTQFPKVVQNTQTINGKSTQLSPEQVTQLQRYVGMNSGRYLADIIDSPQYQNASDNDRVKMLSNRLSDVSAAGRHEVLGDTSKLDANTKAVISGDPITTKVPAAPGTSASTTKTPQERYQAALDKYTQGVKDGTLTGTQLFLAQQSLGKQAITSKYSQPVLDLYGMSKAQRTTAIAQDPSLQALMPQVQQLSTELAQNFATSNDKIASQQSSGTTKKTSSGRKTSSSGRKIRMNVSTRSLVSSSNSAFKKLMSGTSFKAPKVKVAKVPKTRRKIA